MHEVTPKRQERGQAVLEITIVFPLLLGIVFLALALAVGWHAHHLSASLALEGASLQSAAAGQGVGFLSATGGRLAPSAGFTAELGEFPFAYLSGAGVRGQRFSVVGRAQIPWAPFRLGRAALLRGTTYVPIWEFNGER